MWDTASGLEREHGCFEGTTQGAGRSIEGARKEKPVVTLYIFSGLWELHYAFSSLLTPKFFVSLLSLAPAGPCLHAHIAIDLLLYVIPTRTRFLPSPFNVAKKCRLLPLLYRFYCLGDFGHEAPIIYQ